MSIARGVDGTQRDPVRRKLQITWLTSGLSSRNQRIGPARPRQHRFSQKQASLISDLGKDYWDVCVGIDLEGHHDQSVTLKFIFSWAYARGEASYLAVTEYSGFLWAAACGWIVFRETVSLYTLAGAALIVGGCIVAARSNVDALGEIEVAT